MPAAERWNLQPGEWANVLLDGVTPASVAQDLLRGRLLPWTRQLLALTNDSQTVLDLGSGRGDQAAALALNGRRATLLDWSSENLQFSTQLFDALGLAGGFCQADLTRPLPFQSGAFETVFSCGVLEYFDDTVIERVLAEAFRVSGKRVIVMVPNAMCVAYRLGKWYMQRNGRWEWGGEVPFYSLKPFLRRCTSGRVTEYSLGTVHALNFMTMPGGGLIRRAARRILGAGEHSGPSRLRQGYLLMTVAEKA